MYQGLMYIDVRPVRDDEWATLPHSKITATNEEDDGEQTTRAEIEANLTASIEDELIGSVIEYEIDGNIFH